MESCGDELRWAFCWAWEWLAEQQHLERSGAGLDLLEPGRLEQGSARSRCWRRVRPPGCWGAGREELRFRS